MAHATSGFVDPLLTSTAYHIHQAESALSSLKQIVREDAHDGWKKALKHKKSGVVVHMKSAKNDKTPIFKGEAVIHGFSPQSVFYVIGMRKLWDEQYDDGNLVENLNDTTSLTYEVSKPTSSLCANSMNRPRDMALVEKIECTRDGAIMFACTSVETPRVPRIQGRVRAQIKLQGWVLEPIRGPTPTTRVTYVIQENMKGWMSGFAKKSLARRPLVIALVNDYLQKKAERIRSTKMRGTGTCSSKVAPSEQSLSTERFQSTRRPSLLDQTPSGIQPLPSSSNLSTNRPFFATTTQDATLSPLFESSINPSLESSLSNSSENSTNVAKKRQPLYLPHRFPSQKAEALNLIKRMTASLEPWTLTSENNGIKVYAMNEQCSISLLHASRMDGTIRGEWTPEQLCSVVNCFGARKIWDKQFIDGRIVERFSQRDYLVEWSHALSSLATNTFNAIISIDTDLSSGVITTATSSISSTKEPVERIDGWVFKPNSNEGAVNVIWISNLQQQNQPLLIKELENYMDQFGCPPYIRRVAGKITHESFESNTGQYDVVYIAKHELSTRASSNKQQQQQRWCTDIRVHNSSRYPAGVNMTLSPDTGMRVEMTSSKTSIRIYTTSSDMEGQHVSIRILPGTDNQYTCNGVSLTPRIVINNKTTTTTPPPDPAPTPPQSAEIKSPTDTKQVAINTIPAKPPSPPSVPTDSNDSTITTTSSSSLGQQQKERPPTPTPSPSPQEQQAISTDRRRASVAGKISISQPSRPDTQSHHFTAEQHKRSGQSPKLISKRSQQQQPHVTTKISPVATTERQRLVVPEGYKLIPQQQNNNIIIISDELTFNGQQLAVVILAMVLSYYMGKLVCASSYC
ncbi:hypothetical protein K492DRAFT_155732 [Lichtheimia hyalospora FSU 10163]|nr:hypothetical protein K492DRAFT_155732 [Lichtheimia hyalospora FSU 10163]